MRFLSDHKIICTIIVFSIFIALLASCANESSFNITEAVSQGLILPIDIDAQNAPVQETHHNLATAHIGQLTHTAQFSVNLHFPIQHDLHFESDTGKFTLFTEDGHHVSEGEKLAILTLDDEQFDNERAEINRIQAEIRLQQFDQATTNEAGRRQTEIGNTRFYAEHASNDAELTRLLINLAQLELKYDRFRFETANTRNELVRELDELQSAVKGEYLLATFSGTVRSVAVNQYGTVEGRQPRILSLVDEETFFFTIQTRQQTPPPMSGVLNYGDIITIQSQSPSGSPPTLSFDARVVTDPWAAGIRTEPLFWLAPVDMEGLMESLYEIDPYDPIQVLRTLFLEASVTYIVADYGILVPHNAIQTQDRLFFTFVYEQGDLIRRFVNPHIRAGAYSHIITGLDAGEQVVILP